MNTDPFRSIVRAEGARLYRDLPWRRTRDPYRIWLSEVMLQQTQVVRVEQKMPAWLQRFPSVEALAEAPAADVLQAWQGMGYNRRALALHAAAQAVVQEHGGTFPQDTVSLVALPGIGPATAQGIRAFAYDLPGVYLETNVRTVFLHHFFPDMEGVSDKELLPLVQASCPGPQAPYAAPQDAQDTPRSWYYALLDYGAYLKKQLPNPSRRSRLYARQSKFEGSRRQKRAALVRLLLDARGEDEGLSAVELCARLSEQELAAGREGVPQELCDSILADLQREGFCVQNAGIWRVI